MPKTQPLQPQPNWKWVNPDGTPTQAFRDYMKALDNMLSNVVLGPLVNAANDTAAAAAGVPLQGFYRNGNAVQVRLV